MLRFHGWKRPKMESAKNSLIMALFELLAVVWRQIWRIYSRRRVKTNGDVRR